MFKYIIFINNFFNKLCFFFQNGALKIKAPPNWRKEVESVAQKKLKKRRTEVRNESLEKISDGCYERRFEELTKNVKLADYKRDALELNREFASQEEMDRSFYEKDCLTKVQYSYNNEGTLFNPSFKKCNVSHLNTALDVLKYALGKEGPNGFEKFNLRGITSSMLYFGTYGSSFPWHTEDGDLPSVNYLHQGAPKIWFVVPASELLM